MADNIHEGHRRRVREIYDEVELDAFKDDYKVLEMLLFYVIPQRDTNPIAHKLIEQFDSLQNVLNAPQEKLTRVDGVGEKAARYLNLLGKVFARIRMGDAPSKLTSETADAFFRLLFKDEVREAFYIICLDAKDNVLGSKRLSEGSFESVEIDPAKAVKVALDYNSAQVVFAHNHPSGIDIASDADIQVTRVLNKTMRFMGIHMRDHRIFTGDKCISIADNYDISDKGDSKYRGRRR